MKMNKLVKGLLVGFIALQMVGCEEAKEVENIEVQDTKPVVEEVENEYCDNCGNRLDYCECNEEPQVEEVAPVEDKSCKFTCINCGKIHYEYDSWYNEDGMSACSEACYHAYLDTKTCEMCGNYTNTLVKKGHYDMQVCLDCEYGTCDICLAPKTEKPITFNDGCIHMCNDCYKVEYAEEIANAKVKKAEEEAIQARIDAHEICPECHSENVEWYQEDLAKAPGLIGYCGDNWWVRCHDCGFAN